MARATSAPARKARKNKLFSKSKGYFQARNNRLRQAHQAVMKAESYAYRGRKERKRQFRRLWIVRINAALKPHSMRYSQFIHGLKLAEIHLDRKIMAGLAVNDPEAFGVLVNQAREALEG